MISAGTRIGPYEVLAPLGAGGMGEVWLARDPRLGREVAVKVLPEEFSSDRERVKRFEREARAASALNHPNIVTIHEIGEADGRAFLVMERIDGQTLRELLLEGPLPMRRLLSIAAQAADGLARAHESGIVHRDLKPENLMVTRDGFVKILDFGLAKRRPLEAAGREQTAAEQHPMAENSPTAFPTVSGSLTAAGIVLGTVGYMSPEQAIGKPLDHRSDQFSLGAILYEMASGRRPFEKSTPVETLSAIIREDPEPIGSVNPRAPAPLQWTIERCLSKKPEDRYVATRDLARDLASFRDHLSDTTIPAESISAPPRKRRLLWQVVAGTLLLAAVAVGSFFLGTQTKKKTPLPTFHRLTFRRGHIWSARFTPDGQTVVYGAAWDGKPVQIFSTRPGNPESVPLSLPSADILSVSPAGELAICLGRHNIGTWETAGTLARAPLSGSAPREVLESVAAADWNPGGSSLALVHVAGGVFRLEYPEGKTLSESPGWISHPRVSPKGDAVAFFDHPIRGDDSGQMWVVDSSGKKKALSRAWYSAQGLAWSPGGREIWFTASDQGFIRALHAVTPAGSERVIAEFVGTLQDVFRDGRALVTRDLGRARILARPPGETRERDLSWFDTSIVADLSADGTTLLSSEGGEGSVGWSSVYLRRTDGSPAVRLGEGSALALSPDGRWALSATKGNSELRLLPTGVGEARRIERYVESYEWAGFLPDGKQILFAGREKGRPARLFAQDLEAGTRKARPVTPEGAGAGYLGHAISPDGRFVTGPGADSSFLIYPVKGGTPTPIAGLSEGEVPAQWSADGQYLYVYRPIEVPARIFRLELSTGRREPWKELLPDDLAGVNVMATVVLTRDGRSYAYTCGQFLSDLYLVEGLK